MTSPVFTVLPLAWLSHGSAPAVFNSHLGDLLDRHSAAGTGRGAVEQTALRPVKCPHLPPCLQPQACGTAAGCVLAGSATTAPCTSSTGLRQLPDTSNSFSRFPQAPGSCSYILTPALPLLTTQAALGTHRCRAPSWHGAGVWHCREGMEQTHGTDGQTRSTRVALMDRPGAHVWHQWTDQENTRGTARWARSTRVAPMDR